MKQSKADIIEIVLLVREQFSSIPDKHRINRYRLNAVNQIAHRRNVNKTTIKNSYMRASQFNDTKHFQKCLEDWLLNESNELINIITRYIPMHEKEDVIAALQNKKTEVQKLLDYEVMDSVSQNKYPEGRSKIDIHLTKERKQQLVSDAKQEWKKYSNGDIKCSVCNFSFFKKYGIYGKDFIEAHHNTPISELTEETVVRISDLSPVCSNCHRIIHRKRPFLSISELREIVHVHGI